jgi:signal peptidase II
VATPGQWLLLVALVAVLAADQALKAAVLSGGAGTTVVAIGPARLRPVLAGPTFAGRLRASPPVLAGAWIAGLVAVLAAGPAAGALDGGLARVAAGAAFGGAAGNLVDLVVRRAIVDYVEVGRWPAFNLADVAIVSGVGVALLAG